MGAIICGNEKCSHPIRDVSDTHQMFLATNVWQIDDQGRQGITVYECPECGALTMFWQVWPDGESMRAVYLAQDGESRELAFMKRDEFFISGE